MRSLIFLVLFFFSFSFSSPPVLAAYPPDTKLSKINGSNGYYFTDDTLNPYTYLGTDAKSAGDLNNDGLHDFMIDSTRENSNTGALYIIFGSSTFLKPNQTVPDITLSALANSNGQLGFRVDGEHENDLAGWKPSALGDVNGDGIDDIILGATGWNNNTGKLYVLFGSKTIGTDSKGVFKLSNINGSNGFNLIGEAGQRGIGWTSSAGDFNGDGFSDILVTTGYFGNPNSTLNFRSYIIYGSQTLGSVVNFSLSSLNGTNGFKLDAEYNTNFWYNPCSLAGDVNGDMLSDILIGSPGALKAGGRTWLLYGTHNIIPQLNSDGIFLLQNINGTNGLKLDGQPYENSGYNSYIGDIDKDGYDEIAISSPGGCQELGCLYIIFGGPNLTSLSNPNEPGQLNLTIINGTNGFKIIGEESSAFGYSFGSIGDLNQDGLPDLIIGAWAWNNGGGRTYILFSNKLVTGVENITLKTFIDGNSGFELSGINAGGESGYSVSGLGDVNGDGYLDFLISEPLTVFSRVYLIYPRYLQQN